MALSVFPVQSCVMGESESNRLRRWLGLIAAIVALAFVSAGIWATLQPLRPTPPRTVVMSTVPQGKRLRRLSVAGSSSTRVALTHRGNAYV
jgi:hypothetical protein